MGRRPDDEKRENLSEKTRETDGDIEPLPKIPGTTGGMDETIQRRNGAHTTLLCQVLSSGTCSSPPNEGTKPKARSPSEMAFSSFQQTPS
ncbi:hypothetical protein RUM43_000229 [Polyplax serrata]|uniref:Uncharacterized protein n=1 Tax=Polyplax serrata TaxID=468196 RepID=A0AAN8SD26_POLSC